MENKKIESLMQQAMTKIKDIIDVNTIVGNPIVCEEITIIPITKVVVGFVAGGGEYSQVEKPKKQTEEYPFAGGASAGVSVLPIGFIMIDKNGYQFITADNKSTFQEVLKIFAKITENMKGNEGEKWKEYSPFFFAH